MAKAAPPAYATLSKDGQVVWEATAYTFGSVAERDAVAVDRIELVEARRVFGARIPERGDAMDLRVVDGDGVEQARLAVVLHDWSWSTETVAADLGGPLLDEIRQAPLWEVECYVPYKPGAG